MSAVSSDTLLRLRSGAFGDVRRWKVIHADGSRVLEVFDSAPVICDECGSVKVRCVCPGSPIGR